MESDRGLGEHDRGFEELYWRVAASQHAERRPAPEQEDDGPLAPDGNDLIPEGRYLAQCTGVAVLNKDSQYNWERKLALEFKVMVVDEAEGCREVILHRYLNYPESPGRGSDYYKEWVKANGGVRPRRNDRMSPKVFKGKLFNVRVATVARDRDRDSLDGDCRYSKVAKILNLVSMDLV